jgi:hypothetical protein
MKTLNHKETQKCKDKNGGVVTDGHLIFPLIKGIKKRADNQHYPDHSVKNIIEGKRGGTEEYANIVDAILSFFLTIGSG